MGKTEKSEKTEKISFRNGFSGLARFGSHVSLESTTAANSERFTARACSDSAKFLAGKATFQGRHPKILETRRSWSACRCCVVIVTGDFNGGRKSDVAVATLAGQTIGVLLGKGDGTLGTAIATAASVSVTSLAPADYDRNGKLDLAYNGLVNTIVTVLPGKGNGMFQPGVAYHAGVSVYALATGDFNNDGKPDVANVGTAAGILLNTRTTR